MSSYDPADVGTLTMTSLGLLLPHADPLSVRLRWAHLVEAGMQRRRYVRDLSSLIIRARRQKKARQRRRTIKRLERRSLCMDRQTIDDSVRLANQFEVSNAHVHRIARRVHIWATDGAVLSLFVGPFLPAVFFAFGIRAAGLPAAVVACGVMTAVFGIYAALHAGWSYGYNQALWHSAEGTLTQSTEDDSRRSQEAAQEAQRQDEMRAELATRRMAISLPPKLVFEGYIYVVEFDTGVVKVGQTLNPAKRLPTHRAEAAAFGVTVTNYWISPHHITHRDNETRLINACVRVSTRTRREYFHDVPFRTAVGFASRLTYPSRSDNGTSVEGGWR